MKNNYDIIILGGGPIGASTIYFLNKSGVKNVALITSNSSPEDNQEAAYLNSGGSIRWFWDDPIKQKATKDTADFILKLASDGTDLSLIQDNYLFLNKGKFVPSINVNGSKLVNWFLESASSGVDILKDQKVIQILNEGEFVLIKTDKGEFSAKKVLVSLGYQNPIIIPDYNLDFEKRQLFVLDIPVSENEKNFPHTIIPIKNGVAYVFIKNIDENLHFVVGQEDIVKDNENNSPIDYFAEILEAGLGDIMPFLKQAKINKILWGLDASTKNLNLDKRGNMIIANCGSAIRACVYIGEKLAEELTI